MNSSSSAYPIRPIRPERFAVPHHRLLGQPSYRRAAAGMVIPRRFSSLSVDEDAVPPHLVKLPPLEGEVIHPYKGVIRADLGQFRPLTVEGVSVKNGLLVDGIELDKPRLPLVRQISFHEAKDIHLTQWETPMSYLNRCPAIRPAGMYNPLLHQPDKLMMLTPYGRTLWKSAVDLICVNRARGYCISRALFEENLVVSSLHGTFGLSRPIADDLPENPMDFVGFKALKRLFVSLMVRRYGQAAFDLLLPDVLDWLEVLDNPAASFEELPEYHGCLLPDEGRAWLGVRIAQIFTNELEDIIKEFACSLAFQRLYPLSEGIDELHSFFEEWHRHARAMRKDKEKDLWALVEPDISPEELEQWKVESEKWKVNTGGRWIIMMHRHGFLHSHSYRLSKLARRRYTSKHVVDLMHCKLPMYLPAVQSICGDLGIWGRLDMRRCFPKPVTYPVLDLDKMKMKATCYPVI